MTYNTLDIQKELPPGWESTDLGSVAEYIITIKPVTLVTGFFL